MLIFLSLYSPTCMYTQHRFFFFFEARCGGLIHNYCYCCYYYYYLKFWGDFNCEINNSLFLMIWVCLNLVCKEYWLVDLSLWQFGFYLFNISPLYWIWLLEDLLFTLVLYLLLYLHHNQSTCLSPISL